ncbi:hypothetical protein M406DRAFT_259757 [Cryphonectria parasitica EP155]|uniref:Uncharacterized protein n=1 Tax=Cryphonectria parasitica (strain ATCC 38755 / EP155) TaxID=660469 RepID=A0A9P4Y1R2_CRYP1|nr:uncharacterized protein M406DRAFT_259757 [Cryphonectria parasitica EP155]KAF3764903.1 hypothetical protein M406DRAFT_259757 [Cryphonectria parasitica EP155]
MAAPIQPTVATHNDFGTVNVVETPTSPSSAFTLSRFEFETGTKGNEGTKILMVEWDAAAALGTEGDSAKATTKANLEDWEVKWEGKEAVTLPPIRDVKTPNTTCRLYFLLPPKAPMPTLVTISPKIGNVADLHTKPLPAIFPEGLVSEDKGTRGVLHMIWAKMRLEELQAEIVAEMKENGESVGLEMAVQERQWIVDHFGLQIDTSSAEAIPLPPQSPGAGSPRSPRSPIGGKLGEKLKGLKLATSPAELAAAKGAGKKSAAIAPDTAPATFQPRPMVTGSAGGIASLSAVMHGGATAPERGGGGDTEEDLFALPMSPRSPEMLRSPFSLLKS